ncbi:MAG: acetylornithine transaminase [Deltaproteobacteria bacterium]|nr:acetylornithine transaminase [Deltaproteobacteria bacterium]
MMAADTGDKNDSWVQRGQKVLLGNYKPMPITLVSGEGARVTDADGNSYIDFVSGIAVTSLGHNHPQLIAAIREQAGKILHTANVVWNEQAIMLAEKLVAKSFAERVFFCNSGAEAVEAMLKLARKVFFDRGEGRFEIISFDKSFHGRTMGALTATGQEKYRLGFEPLLPGVKTVPYGDIQALEQAMTERTAAVLLEPIQGEAGVRMAPAGFLKAVRDLTQRHGCLMLLDEVQTGVGRCGTMWAYEHDGVVPDAMSIAKGIGGGLPLGAMLTTTALGAALPFGSHGSTFGGNPLACAAGNVVVDVVSDPAFLARVKALGEHLLGRLHQLTRTHRKLVVEARGRGLLCGLELNVDLAKLPRMALSKGLLLNTIAGKIIRFAPPLTIDQATLDQGLDLVEQLLVDMSSEPTRV